MNKEKRTEIFRRFAKANPDPKTELEYSTTFELLVAVLLSAQATDKSVNLATRKLFSIANTPAAILEIGEETLLSYIKTIGLYRTKGKHLMQTCEMLIEHHNGQVPSARESLESLPGVGRKTANVILNTAFGQPTMAVDTHIFRLSNRTGIAPGNNVLDVENRLLRLIPSEFMLNAHHWLILHGRYVCKARKPSCPSCGIADLCEMNGKTI